MGVAALSCGGSRAQVRAQLTLGAADMQSRPRLPPELSSTKGYMQDLAVNSLSFGVNEKQCRLSYRLPLVVILVFSMQIDCSLYIKCQTFPQV